MLSASAVQCQPPRWSPQWHMQKRGWGCGSMSQCVWMGHACGGADAVVSACMHARMQMALKAARAACQRHPSNARAWAVRMPLEVSACGGASASTSSAAPVVGAGASAAQAEKLLAAFREAFAAVALDDISDVWMLVSPAMHALHVPHCTASR